MKVIIRTTQSACYEKSAEISRDDGHARSHNRLGADTNANAELHRGYLDSH
jgi:hypothetical protein